MGFAGIRPHPARFLPGVVYLRCTANTLRVQRRHWRVLEQLPNKSRNGRAIGDDRTRRLEAFAIGYETVRRVVAIPASGSSLFGRRGGGRP